MNPNHPLVSARAGYLCEYCHAPEAVFNLSFEVEHILPKSAGGTDDEDNPALSCRSCNLYKSAFTSAFDELTATEVRLSNPRPDNWREHFTINSDNGFLTGSTEIGRAAIICLRINSSAQTAARRQWLRLGFEF